MSPTSGPQRVVILSKQERVIGGMERTVVNLARELKERGWDTRAVLPDTPASPDFDAWCAEQGVQPETGARSLPYPLDGSTGGKHLASCLRQHDPQVVNLHYGAKCIPFRQVLAVRRAGVRRCVASVHLASPWKPAEERRRMMVTRLAALLCDAVVVTSGMAREIALQAGIASHKVRVIPYGVSVPDGRLDKRAARRQFGLPDEAFVVCTVARLLYHKAIPELIDGVSRLRRKGREVHLLIVGSGEDRADFERMAADKLPGRCHFAGFLRDPSPAYVAADLFALASYWEGSPLVFQEAALNGLPSVASAVGGVPEAILDGESGLLVPAGDREALADAMQRVYDDEVFRQSLGAAARARALSEFTVSRMADRYDALLREKCRRKGGL